MYEFDEGTKTPVETLPLKQNTLEGKDYPRDTGFVTELGAAIIEFIREIGDLLFGASGYDTQTEMPETQETREYNESTERKAAEVMAEVFDQETLEKWTYMDAQERQAKLEEYYYKLADVLGIPPTELVIADLNPEGYEGFTFGCFVPDTGEIYIDYRIFENPEMLGQTLSTLTHETRHQFQQNVVENPDRYPDVPQRLVEVWTNNMPPPSSNYKDADTYGFETYYSQPIEVDAESFAQGTMIEFNKIRNGK